MAKVSKAYSSRSFDPFKVYGTFLQSNEEEERRSGTALYRYTFDAKKKITFVIGQGLSNCFIPSYYKIFSGSKSPVTRTQRRSSMTIL